MAVSGSGDQSVSERNLPVQDRDRPFGVTVIATAMVANAIIAAGRAYLGDASITLDEMLRTEFYFELAGPFVGAVGLIMSVGLWRLQRWAWVATMSWAGINMAQALWAYWVSEPQYSAMALSVVIVLYLNQREVQLAFIESTRGIMRDG
jgi:hypothetical protein